MKMQRTNRFDLDGALMFGWKQTNKQLCVLLAPFHFLVVEETCSTL
jgi:hypothetical protein